MSNDTRRVMRPGVPRTLAAAFVVLLLNAAYLALRADPTVAYYIQVALHPLLGIGIAVGAAWHFAPAWRTTRLRAVAGVTLAAAAALGAVVLGLGATRPYYGLLRTHVAVSVLGTALLAVEIVRSARHRPVAARRALLAAGVIAFVLVAGIGVANATRDGRRGRAFRIANPDVVPASMNEEGGGPRHPFFPSSAGTGGRGVIPTSFFLTSNSCGRCHREIFEEWSSSMHHFASFNNQWYRKSVEYMQDVIGVRPSKWCAGCHDHALLFSGRFEQPIATQVETPEAQAGLSCTSCHAISQVHGTMGQGGFEIEFFPVSELASSDNPLIRTLHDKLLELAPQPHRESFLKPFHREQPAEFCSSCHKVHLDVPVNGYRWLRGFNDYDNWQASGVSGQGARSFYYPPRAQTCADCHMPLVASQDPAARGGKVRSHRFAAANTAVPFANGDHAQLQAVQSFLRDGQVTVDLFGVARTDAPPAQLPARSGVLEEQTATTFGVGEESFTAGPRMPGAAGTAAVVEPFGVVPVTVTPGESVRVEVVVRTRKVGHFFPGGTVDAFDVWVELEARDDRGRLLLHSGGLEPSGAVDAAAHRYRSLLLDEHGNPINKRNAWAARSTAFVRLIPPGAADTIHYRLDIPADVGDTITLTARVKYRKFAWWNTQWAYAGIRDPAQPSFALAAGHDDGRWVFAGDTSRASGRTKAIPEPPITEMATGRATMAVQRAARGAAAATTAATPEAAAAAAGPALRERWNDYGIGLLLQGDLRGAETAFLRVADIDPAYADAWVNVGRARVQEGDMEGAEEVLRKALSISPALAKTHFFLGTALRSLGRYDEALFHLRQAASQYPADRVVLNQIGRVLFQQRQYQAAIDELRNVLAIDPEDLQAHYTLMLCYQGLGDSAGAERERVLYQRFKADEASQAIAGDFRRLNPDDNNERQQIHEHRTMRTH